MVFNTGSRLPHYSFKLGAAPTYGLLSPPAGQEGVARGVGRELTRDQGVTYFPLV